MAPRVKELPEDTAARVAAEADARADSARTAALNMQAQQGYTGGQGVDASIPIAAGKAAQLAQDQEAARAQSAEAELQAERSIKAGLSPVNTAPFTSPATLADTARVAGAAASSLVPGMGAAPGSTTPAGAAADAARLSAAPKVEPVGLHSPAVTPPQPKMTAKAAETVVNAPANRVEAVIAKLKDEEKKGGPGIWDVIEAAAAGWHGRVPLYTQKALEAAAEESRMEQLQQTASLQAAIEAEQQAEAYKRQRALLGEELASREKIAGLKEGTAGLSPLAMDILGGL